jgi:putative sigma-54 modulation protein
MNIQIRTAHFAADPKLIGHVMKRIEKLPSCAPEITSVGIFFRLDNLSHQVADKIAGIRIHLPHRELFTRYLSKSFEQSFNKAFDSMVLSIRRKKDRQLS